MKNQTKYIVPILFDFTTINKGTNKRLKYYLYNKL